MKKCLASLIAVIIMSVLVCGCEKHDNAVSAGAGPEASKEQLVVLAAASVTDALNEISAEFSKSTSISVVASYASSSDLARQIQNGADADVFISANQKWADYLGEKQLVDQRTNLLFNKIVIVVPADSSITGDNAGILLNPEIKSVAMGDPSAVPAGKYGQEALTTLGLWDKISPKVAAAKDVRSALAYVETRAAEAGIVYSTDASISSKVKVIYQFPDELLKEPVSYPALTLSNAVNSKNAHKFFEYLQGPTARAIFTKYGFVTQ